MIKKILYLILFLTMLTVSYGNTRTHTEYFPNGKVQLQGVYVGEKKVGYWSLFNSEGYKIREYSYINGEELFYITNFNSKGIIQSSGMVERNQQEGEWSYFDPNGLLIFKVTFSNGVKNGPFVAYNEKANPIVIGIFENDYLVNLLSLKQ